MYVCRMEDQKIVVQDDWLGDVINEIFAWNENILHDEIRKPREWRKKAIIIDWSNFLFRYFSKIWDTYSEQFWDNNLNWIYWIMKKVFYHLEEGVDYLYICWEWWKEESIRKHLYKEYKEWRKAKSEDFKNQYKKVQKLLKLMKIPSLAYKWYECDDIIWTLTKMIDKRENWNVDIYIHSTDKDFAQLLQENVFLFKPQRRQMYWLKEFYEEYWIDVKYFIDFLALLWDSSDNIKWVPWLWMKGIPPLINKYWSIENIYKNINEAYQLKLLKEKSLNFMKTKEWCTQLMLNKKLITLMNIPECECKYISEYWITRQHLEDVLINELWFNSFSPSLHTIFHY